MEDNLKRLGAISAKDMPGPSKFVKPYTIAYELVRHATSAEQNPVKVITRRTASTPFFICKRFSAPVVANAWAVSKVSVSLPLSSQRLLRVKTSLDIVIPICERSVHVECRIGHESDPRLLQSRIPWVPALISPDESGYD